MHRLLPVKPAVFAALGAAALLISPATALASTTGAHPMVSQETYAGTYPDTPAGGNACEAEGVNLIQRKGGKVYDFQCLPDNPYPGINLWAIWSNGNCNFCIAGKSPSLGSEVIFRHRN
jgi:hypothetical protein